MPLTYEEAFSTTYLLNLDRRPDRLASCITQFASVDLSFTRIPAIDGQTLDWNVIGGYYHPGLPHSKPTEETFRGIFGCNMSHTSAIHAAKKAKAPYVAVFEDDVIFSPNFKAFCTQGLAELPDDWAMFYMAGAHRKKPLPVSDHLVRCRDLFYLMAYIVKADYYDLILETSATNLTTYPLDELCSQLHKSIPVYALNPLQIVPIQDFSDVERKYKKSASAFHSAFRSRKE